MKRKLWANDLKTYVEDYIFSNTLKGAFFVYFMLWRDYFLCLRAFFLVLVIVFVFGIVLAIPNISLIPRGNGDGRTTEDEVYRGSWKFNSFGRSFTTYLYSLPSNADRDGTCLNDRYFVRAGRSNLGANTRIINDFPVNLGTEAGVSNISGFKTSKFFVDVPVWEVVKEGGVRKPWTRFVAGYNHEKDGNYEGGAQSPFLAYGGRGLLEGGDFLLKEMVFVKARTSKSERFIVDVSGDGLAELSLPSYCERDVVVQFEVSSVLVYLHSRGKKSTKGF